MGFCCVCGYCTTGLKEEFFLSWNAAVALTGQSIDMQRGRLKLICWKFVLQHTILELTVMKQENWLTTRVQNVPTILMTASHSSSSTFKNFDCAG